MQIFAIEAETPEHAPPALITLPGTSEKVTIARAVTFTGDRFVNTLARTGVAQQTMGKRSAEQPARQQPKHRCAGPRSSSKKGSAGQADSATMAGHSGAVNGDAHGQHASHCDSQGNLDGSCGVITSDHKALACVLSATPAFAAIVREQAPMQLSKQQALSLVEACKYFLADALMQLMPLYLRPMLTAMQLAEVRKLPLECSCQG
jgi:hypothetical protein